MQVNMWTCLRLKEDAFCFLFFVSRTFVFFITYTHTYLLNWTFTFFLHVVMGVANFPKPEVRTIMADKILDSPGRSERPSHVSVCVCVCVCVHVHVH